MNGIYDTDNTFDFSKLMLISPTNMTGGNYFIKFRINNAPLYIQPPKCRTKQGIFKSGKKMYCDLMFTNENESFIQWMENLEAHCRKIIYNNRASWFETDLDEHDIENSFTSPLKLYKSGKCYIIRTTVPNYLGECSLTIYNEDEEEVSISEIQEDSDVNTILEIQGIRCSPRSFLVDIEIKQMMVIKPKNIFKKCLLKRNEAAYEMNRTGIIGGTESGGEVQPTVSTSVSDAEYNSNHVSGMEPTDISENKEESIAIDTSVKTEDLFEPVEINLDVIPETEVMVIKSKKDIYYQMYRDAKKKAKLARDLALSSYLEAKKIKNVYMLEDMEDSDSDLDDSFEDSLEEHSYME